MLLAMQVLVLRLWAPAAADDASRAALRAAAAAVQTRLAGAYDASFHPLALIVDSQQ